jgi:hypothetical protein
MLCFLVGILRLWVVALVVINAMLYAMFDMMGTQMTLIKLIYTDFF